MTLSPGARLGVYEILSVLGSGGMGEVYRARDSKLDRLVAVKILPAAFTTDPGRLRRFRREAQLLASLNHPHIAQVYGLDEIDAQQVLVLELIDGESLDRRIARGRIPVDEALTIARQVAEALDAAHEKNIVHRDLKPANIALTKNGVVKVLDFGLAKALETDDELIEAANAPTSPAALTTMVGTVLGTAAYMAPEQAQGRPVDKRADIWAFGVVLFEMLTGDRPFTGSSTAEVLAGVLSREPDWRRVPPQTQTLLRRCLEKDPKRRLRDIGESPFLMEEPSPAPRATAARAGPWIGGAIAAVALAAVAVAIAVFVWRGTRSTQSIDRALTRLNVDLGVDALQTATLETAISPDGRRLVFVARSSDGKRTLAIRSLDQLAAATLANTDDAASPFFSPDGRWIGFFAHGKLKKLSVPDGAIVTIADASGALGASWGDDQNIYFTPTFISPIMRVSANGGTPQPLMTKPGTRLGERGDATHRWPQVLPGATGVMFTSHKIVTGFDDAAIEVVAIKSGERKILVKGGYFGRYLAVDAQSGYLLFVREGVLFGVRFDADSLTIRGTPAPVLEDVAGDSETGAGQFAFASTGTLLYRSGKGPARRWPMLWLDSSGNTQPLISEPGAYYTPRMSPDGTRLALTVDHGDAGREIEVYDWQHRTMMPLTFTKEINLFPVWSPDGKYIVFEASSPHGYGLAVVRADGSGTMQRVAESDTLMIPYSFTPDGYLAYSQRGFKVARFDTTDPDHLKLGAPEQIEAGGSPAFSPDGHWIAYRSPESGRDEVYVRRFHGSGAKYRVSTDGDGYSGFAWAPSGRRLYYVSPDNRIMAVDYDETGDAFVASTPRVWSAQPIGSTVFPRNFSVSADGNRFVVMPPRTPVGDSGSAHVTFVLNFLDELRRRVPSVN